MYSIYMHCNKINNKKYIGQTSLDPPEKRWKNGYGYNTQMFFQAIKKYGWDNFEHIILETGLTAEEANIKEKYYIQLYNTMDSNYGYNCTEGGSNFSTLSDEIKQKIKDHMNRIINEFDNNNSKLNYKRILDSIIRKIKIKTLGLQKEENNNLIDLKKNGKQMKSLERKQLLLIQINGTLLEN